MQQFWYRSRPNDGSAHQYQQQRLSRRTTPAASSTATAVPVTTGTLPACPVQGASEPLSAYLQRLQAFTDAVATAKAQQEAAEAERQRLANEAAAQTQWTAEADAAARDRRNAASTESLIQNENQWTTLLQGMIVVPTDAQADPTPAEAERSNLANLMLSVMRGVMWNNKLLQAHLLTELQHRQNQQQDIVALTDAVRTAATQQQQQHQLLNSALACINSIEAKTSAAPGCTTDTAKQLNEHIDHVVNLIGELASCRTVPAEDMMKALYLQLIGGAQAWMNHLAATKKCTIAELHTHITWKEFEQLWFTRFMVRNVVKAAMNEVYTSSQGSMPTRDWTIEWQKIVTTPGFDLSFTNQRSECFSRSCAGLRTALGNEYDYASFQAILDRTNLVIQTDDKAANERQSQPHYVAKQGYQRPTHSNAVISEETVDLHAAAASSSDGGTVAALPPKRLKRVRKNKATQATTSTGTGQQPWTAFNITKEVFDLRQRIRDAIARNDVEEMGLVFLHALPSPDGPAASPPDPRISHLLDEYRDVFEVLTGTVPDRPIRHGITLEAGAVPPRGCIYRMSDEELEVLRAQLDDLLDKGWIRPSCSLYGAPVLFVWKKNKDLRLCIDYHKLNAQTVKNAGPLPRIDDLLEQLGSATYFSKLDLKSGYHQIEIQPQDRYKNAFKMRYGHFEWVVMPFGLTNAPATFQAAMTTEFHDLLDCSVLIYLDDILVYICHRNKVRSRIPFGELKLLPIPRAPRLSIAMDVTGPFPRDRLGHDSILTVVDRLSKHPRFLPCKYHAVAPELARLLHTGWITNQGVPEDIVSDRDTRFMSAFWTSLMAESGTTMKPSSARHRQTDGQTERAHQTAQMMLRTLIRPDQKDWVDRLPDIEFAYNTSVHPAICVIPFELHHGGEKARIFADLLLSQAADIDVPCSPASVRKYRDLLIKARANMQKAQIRMQQQANRRRLPCPFREGDLVWVLSEEFALEQDVSCKLLPKWFGPWEVASAVGDDPAGPSFVINIPPHLPVHRVFHASKLAIYTPPSADEFPGRRSQDRPSMDGHQEVDRVITHRKYGNKAMQFKVTFKQCAPDDTRWISSADLQTSAPLIFADYEKRRLAKEAARSARPTPVSDRQLRPRR
ncbi:hypothetical protein CBR_g38089 [Chara braunii]|uniref:Integrase catalytic domain-containing protein n=1 Tax=Chara braunii TaxID=69332 RepID=A0A388K083_CHABU|nr:hypothetical protein CBR_g38089 [Chara braunii]|eukprot:GBG63471.1 hypothetical protein CBR_g38089 [Chara braunii]